MIQTARVNGAKIQETWENPSRNRLTIKQTDSRKHGGVATLSIDVYKWDFEQIRRRYNG